MSAPLVLVIEDNPDLVEMATDALHRAGYCVRAALGSAALQIAAREQPAVILLDLGLPELDGRQIAQYLRAHPQTCQIPIVAMSGHDPFGALAQALGAQDHLTKPFDSAVLEAVVARWAPRP